MTSFTSFDMLICLVTPEHAGDACGILVGNVPIAKPLAIANLGGFLEHACEASFQLCSENKQGISQLLSSVTGVTTTFQEN